MDSDSPFVAGIGQVIPAEAVEAAAKALKDRCGAWDSWTVLAQTALEAAAPIMLAEAKADAWDEGASGGLSWDEALGEDFPTPNPYRTTA